MRALKPQQKQKATSYWIRQPTTTTEVTHTITAFPDTNICARSFRIGADLAGYATATIMQPDQSYLNKDTFLH